MSIKVYKFRSVDEMERHLRGVVMGKVVSRGVADIVGKTLKLLKPEPCTLTFQEGGTGGGFLTFAEIEEQIEEKFTGIEVTQVGGAICLRPTTGSELEFDESTGAHLLGFSNAAGGKSYVYSTSDTPPAYIQSYAAGDILVLVVDEPEDDEDGEDEDDGGGGGGGKD